MNRRHFLGGAVTTTGPRLYPFLRAAANGTRRRYFYNDDGDSVLLSYEGPFRREQVTDSADVLAGTGVTTLVLCVCYGDLLTYDSKVGSMYAWRKTPAHESGRYQHAYEFFQFVRRNRWDIPKMVQERAAAIGLEFIPTMRMNDAHFAQKIHPREHPLTSEFWLNHQDLTINPRAKWPDAFYNEFVMDYRHELVRDFRLRTALEIIDRYGDLGFEMDWTRHYQFFKKGEERPELITEMVRQIRQHLTRKASADGRRRLLIARVAATPEISRRCGLDVDSWIRERLVDVVVPSSPTRVISLDIPVRPWMELVKGTGIEIHPSPDSAGPRGDGLAHLEMYRAAASNCYMQGADGFYLFNLFAYRYPLPDEAYLIMRDVSQPQTLARRDKLYMATRDNWRDGTDTLPVRLEHRTESSPARIGIMTADNLIAARDNKTLRKALLRLRIGGVHPEDRFSIAFDGSVQESVQVYRPTFTEMETARKGMTDWTYEARMVKVPWMWMEVDFTSNPPREGDHIVSIWRNPRLTGEPLLTDVDLQVQYDFAGHAAP